jgi:hypothetical protein
MDEGRWSIVSSAARKEQKGGPRENAEGTNIAPRSRSRANDHVWDREK